jgi:hypothetical protein
MSEPDNPRWLEESSGELRAEVPVRPAWRAELIDEIARSPRPMRGHVVRPARRLVLHPLAAIAAALVFAALGAGTALTLLPARGTSASDSMIAGVGPSTVEPTGATALPAVDAASDQALVRFELSAPTASRVALVGSFNRWNPIATPLERDSSSGKWIVSLRLPPGRHVYAFVVDGDVTADPAAPRAADADFGTPNSVVLVSGRSS